jgi:uncharacterized membrane protein YvbJ
MLCPRCGARQPLGSVRCANCGTPFTRREAAKRPGSRRLAPAGGSPVTAARAYERRSGVRKSVMAWLVVLLLVVIAVIALATYFSSSIVKPYVGRSVNNDLQGQIAASVPKVTPVSAASDNSDPNQLIITQKQINDEIAKNAGSFGPLSSVDVEIDDGAFIVNFSAYGMSGKYQGQVTMRDGQPVVTNGHVSGMLGWFVPTDQIETAFNREIASAVDQAGVQVNSVSLRPGEMVLTLNS